METIGIDGTNDFAVVVLQAPICNPNKPLYKPFAKHYSTLYWFTAGALDFHKPVPEDVALLLVLLL